MRISLPEGITAAELAATCKVHPSSMHRALNDFDPDTGVHVCGPGLAVAIHHASGGKVPCWSLRPDLWLEGQVPPVPDGVAA
jgi:DNA-binding transcriptional regulator YdaS (Cro superfamily)